MEFIVRAVDVGSGNTKYVTGVVGSGLTPVPRTQQDYTVDFLVGC